MQGLGSRVPVGLGLREGPEPQILSSKLLSTPVMYLFC